MSRRIEVAWRALVDELFEQDGLATVFSHLRNLLMATLVIAAGVFAAETHPRELRGVSEAFYVGYFVAGLGVLLVLLNLVDGLRKLARRQHHVVLRVALIVIYVFVSVRLAQMLFVFRFT